MKINIRSGNIRHSEPKTVAQKLARQLEDERRSSIVLEGFTSKLIPNVPNHPDAVMLEAIAEYLETLR